jgi:hypothetical protein
MRAINVALTPNVRAQRMRPARIAAAGAVATLGILAAVVPVAAFPAKSLYTTIDLKTCKTIRADADGARWMCKGLPGYPVYVAEGDLRMFVSAGPSPEKRRAARQTLRAFNSLFTGTTSRATMEWRFVKQGGRDVPYATILRYETQNDTTKGQILVVTKVTQKESCQVGFVDALANADAIEIARKLADETARIFDCATDPKSVGESGKSPL